MTELELWIIPFLSHVLMLTLGLKSDTIRVIIKLAINIPLVR